LDLHVLFHAPGHADVWHYPFRFMPENWAEIVLAGTSGFVGSSQSLAHFAALYFTL
jgi:hypothetical protein